MALQPLAEQEIVQCVRGGVAIVYVERDTENCTRSGIMSNHTTPLRCKGVVEIWRFCSSLEKRMKNKNEREGRSRCHQRCIVLILRCIEFHIPYGERVCTRDEECQHGVWHGRRVPPVGVVSFCEDWHSGWLASWGKCSPTHTHALCAGLSWNYKFESRLQTERIFSERCIRQCLSTSFSIEEKVRWNGFERIRSFSREFDPSEFARLGSKKDTTFFETVLPRLSTVLAVL